MLKEEFTGLPSDGYEHNIGTFTLIPPGDSPPLNTSGELVELNHIYRDLFQGIEEDTMDIASKEKVVYLPVTMDMAPEEKAVFIPISPRGKPERTIYPGIYNFQVEISSSDTHKRKYLYSSLLNRIYVQMKTEFLVTYRWAHDGLLPPSPLYVRSCVVFSDDSQAEKRVERCTQHTHDDTTNVGLSQEIVKNVLHSAREKGTHGVYYCGKAEEADYWLSVVVELPVAARGSFGHAYQFVCKNSCPNGINRRAIDIIFTLEDANGTVYGRQTVGARCCACPPRDIKHDEKAEAETRGKRRVTSHEPAPHHPPGKKPKLDVKVEAADDVILTLPPMQVIGVKAAVTGLEVMASMMEQAAEFKRNDENYKKCIANIRSQIDKLKKP